MTAPPRRVRVAYDAPPTLARFQASDAFVRVCVGPVGSGKSSACVLELLLRAGRQAPGPDGVRRTRFAVIRNTYRELSDTTRRTFAQWVPAQLCKWHEQSFTCALRFPLRDGTSVESEVMFRALDRPEDVKKLLSLELTGAYLNEVREIGREVFDVLKTRIGRYPSKREGGITWRGIWADTNPWHSQHWMATLFHGAAEVAPRQARRTFRDEAFGVEFAYELFRQPSGRSPDAENVANLPAGYYAGLVAGQDSEWVKVYVDGEDATSVVGSIWGEALSALGEQHEFEHGQVDARGELVTEDVFTSWDLGRSDSTAIWFWRVRGDSVDVIDHYENSLQSLGHYLDVCDAKPYRYVKHWLPHDARARTLASGTSVEDQMRERWPGAVEIGPSLSLLDGIAAARWLLEQRRVRFHPRCGRGLDALLAYRREYDAAARAYSNTPVHDWSSHTADAFRYLAVVARTTGLLMAPRTPKPAARVRGLGQFSLDELFSITEAEAPQERIG